MTRPRKFDHDEARRLRAEGWTLQRIADRLGVTRQAVNFVVSDKARETNARAGKAYHDRRYGFDDEYTERRRAAARAYHRKVREASA